MHVSGLIILSVEPGNVVFDGSMFGYTITYTTRRGKIRSSSGRDYPTEAAAKAAMHETVYRERHLHLANQD